MQRIPEITQSNKLGSYLKDSLSFIKNNLSPQIFKEKVQALGFTSRISYQQVISGKRNFSPLRIPALSKAMDLSFLETQRAHDMVQKKPTLASFPQQPYALGPADILSSPLNTIILNLCGLSQGLHKENILEITKDVFSAEEVIQSIELLLQQAMVIVDEHGHLRKVERSYQLSSPQGVKTDYARRYIQHSLSLAERNYDLPLDEREYTAFTARIKKEDFGKVKDLVRLFRKSIYELSDKSEYDAVAQVNLNAFLVSTERSPSNSQPKD